MGTFYDSGSAKREGLVGNFASEGVGTTITKMYLYDYESTTDDVNAVLAAAQAETSSPVPYPNQQYAVGVGLYATNFNLVPTGESSKDWVITVTWSAPSEGSLSNLDIHPLLRPPKTSINFIEKEVVIEQARNVEALGYQGARAANTPGPIVNGALGEPGEPLLDTEWDGVINIRRWVSDINAVLTLNKTYNRTCNSDTVFGSTLQGLFPPRTLKYQVSQSSEQQEQDNIPFYEINTSIEILKTTDRTINNVGWKYIDDTGELDDVGNFRGGNAGEPEFLTNAGKITSTPGTITYRHLDEVAYSGLVT